MADSITAADDPYYPNCLRHLETEALRMRRSVLNKANSIKPAGRISGSTPDNENGGADPASGETGPLGAAPFANESELTFIRESLGLALSGGGIRSATFNLGIMQ